jgi:hypothetical protein
MTAGTPDRTRTCNRRLRRPMLYPVELRAHRQPHCRGKSHAEHVPPTAPSLLPVDRDGRGRGIRTPDILLPKQARYQTALYPVASRSGDLAVNGKGPGYYESPAAASIRLAAENDSCAFLPAKQKGCRSTLRVQVARPERFELPTTKFVAWYSIQLSYGRAETCLEQ